MVITGLSTGGAETMLFKVLQYIDHRRFSPHVISLSSKGEIGDRIEALGIPVEALGMRPGRFSPLKFVRLVRRLHKLHPDAVHTWMYHADLLGGMAARLAGVRAIGWAIRHSNFSSSHNKRSTLWVMKACSVLSHRIPRKILCCSRVAMDIHISAGYDKGKMVVIPNGFDISRFLPDANARISIRSELGLSKDTPLVGLIARFDPQKNHAGFFEAATQVHLSCPDAHFLLAGAGVEGNNPTLRHAIQQAGVGVNTHLLGRREDISRLMAALDVLASTSSFGEAFPTCSVRPWLAACPAWLPMWEIRRKSWEKRVGSWQRKIWTDWLLTSSRFCNCLTRNAEPWEQKRGKEFERDTTSKAWSNNMKDSIKVL